MIIFKSPTLGEFRRKRERERGIMANEKVDLSKLKTKDLLSLIGKLSPEQMSAVRGAAAEAGLAVATSSGSMFAKLADGSIRVTVEVPSDLAPALEEWASAAGESLEVFLQHFAVESMNAYAQMDWQNAAPVVAAK
jgi:hypothetical protein